MNAKIENLTSKELNTYKTLIRLGDSKELAYNTVIKFREIEAMRENSFESYRKAYTN